MLTPYDINLLLSLKTLQLEKAIPSLKQCQIIINCTDSILNLVTQNPNIIQLLNWQQANISTHARLILGCRRVDIYLQDVRQSSYNTSVSAAIADSSNKNMTVTLERPTASVTNTNRTNNNWFSFAEVATSVAEVMPVELSADDVAQKVEQYKIPCRLNQGEPGLDKSVLPQFLDKFISSFKQDILSKLGGGRTRNNRKRGIAEGVPVTTIEQPEASSNSNGTTTATATIEPETVDTDFSLPGDFAQKMMEGRQRKPDIQTGLKLAIAELKGTSTREALQAIAFNEPHAQNFVADLAEIFKSSNRTVSKAIQEFQDAAVVMLRSGDLN